MTGYSEFFYIKILIITRSCLVEKQSAQAAAHSEAFTSAYCTLYVPDAFVHWILRNGQAVSRLWRLNSRFVVLQAAFLCETALLRCAENSKRSFSMSKDRFEYSTVDQETKSKKLISMVIAVCEAKLAKHNDDIKGLPSAAMAVRESILTFLALVNSDK